MYSLWERLKNAAAEYFKTRVFVVMTVFCILSVILVGRLFKLQIVNGQQYLDDYKLQIQKTRTIQGTRGNIYDRNGKLLAYNELAYSVTIEDNYNESSEKNDALNKEIRQIIKLVEENGDSVIHDFNIMLENGEYEFTMEDETLRLRFIADVYGLSTIDKLTDEQRRQTAEDIIHYLCTDELYGYGIDEDDYTKSEVLKLVTIRYAIGLNRFQKFIPVTVAEDVSEETVAAVMEAMDELPGVEIAEDSMRRYADSKYFANIIGYTGQISQEEYDTLSAREKKRYSLTDTIGKSGLEQIMDGDLQGEKGQVRLYVNSVGKVIESSTIKKSSAGNDLYLTIDADLQKAAYDILEQELAGILLAKMSDVLDYDRSQCQNAADVVVASGDMYYQFIGNDIIDMDHFDDEEAGAAEQRIAASFHEYKQMVLEKLAADMRDPNAPFYKDMEREWQAYQSFIVSDILTADGVLMQEAIDTKDETYQQWKDDETINIYNYLNYAISENWLNVSRLSKYLQKGETYSDASEIYQAMISYVQDRLDGSNSFEKLIYRYMIKAGRVSGRDIAMVLYEQNILEPDAGQYNALADGSLSSYDFIRGKIETLDITPGQLGLEPCTGSVVITDPNDGSVLACVSYPGYDNNRLANSMDSVYYNQLVTDSSRPFYNNATQEKTAPGSTYKPLAAIAGLTEGVISENTYINCDGVYDSVEPNVRCWVYPSAHGTVGIVGGLTHSCNVFFCELGFRLGMDSPSDEIIYDENGNPAEREYSNNLGLDKLKDYAVRFGLDTVSGIEVPETDPQISDEDSVRSSMGQGTNNYTTSQLARYISAVANRGTVYDLTLLDRVETVDGKVKMQQKPKIKNTVEGISQNTWDLVHAGMRGVVENNHTVFGKLNISEIQLFGKTGTAQQSTSHPDHGLFVGFAPSSNPELAMAIRIANGYSSTFAAEVGNDVMEYYYEITAPEELITGTAKKVTVSAHSD